MSAKKKPKVRRAAAGASATAVRVAVKPSRRAKRKSAAARAPAAVELQRLTSKLRPMVRRMVAEAIEDQLDSIALAEALQEEGRVGLEELRRRLGL